MRVLTLSALVLLAMGCRTKDTVVDQDEDGWPVEADCDDTDASVNPAAPEVPYDGVDNDCDAESPDDDLDADGYDLAEDCDDADPSVFPGATEVCNGIDDDCNGEIDDAIGSVWYADLDGDGYGDPDETSLSCDGHSGWVADDTDCDDERADVHPGAVEVCDEADQDCDGAVDEEAVDAPTWYQDFDGDGHGGTSLTAVECTAPEGFVSSSDDCDDAHAQALPGGEEVCDGLDNDCDGGVDLDATDAPTWYADADGDGFGDPATSAVSCEAPSGWLADDSDCDDTTAAVHPLATEVCNEVDDDCDGDTDEDDAADASTWYLDADGDGYGVSTTTTATCDQPSGYAGTSDDCDDADATVSPAATELCNEVDDDCDGTTDEDDAADASTWYIDADGDGYGATTYTTAQCEQPSGWVSDATDCDDLDDTSHPGGTEVCDEADNDCDGDTDEEATDALTFYLDTDGDGWGTASTTEEGCEASSGYVEDAGDCDDADADVSPSATETCNEVDDDCDGDTDEDDASDATTWYADADADGYGDATDDLTACEAPTGYVDDDTDCDDDDADTHPATTEECDGEDDDCDGDVDEGVYGLASDCAGTSCADILASDSTATDGTYWIDPGSAVVEVYCDMSTDGGGWTLAFLKNSAGYGTFPDFGVSYVDEEAVADDPGVSSTSSTALLGWIDFDELSWSTLHLAAYDAGVESWRSSDIDASSIRLSWGDDGYYLYNDTNGYYWCAGNGAYTDYGSGQVSRPSGAPADCKGHGSLGSGWDFSMDDTPNKGLTLCGVDHGSTWLYADFGTSSYSYGTPGGAQAIWLR